MLSEYEVAGCVLFPERAMTSFCPWHVAHVAGMLVWFTGDFGSVAASILCGLP